MSKYLWITDPHFNFSSPEQNKKFLEHVKGYNPAGIFLTGDISTGRELSSHLKLILGILDCPIYFVLGNHDYYRSSFAHIDYEMSYLSKRHGNLHYLNNEDPISLSEKVAVIGHNGWYDAGWRTPVFPFVFWADWYFIHDFRFHDSNADRMSLMKYKAEVATENLKIKLEKSLKTHHTTYLLTHFPPWPEKIDKWGGLVETFWKPYNSCKVAADMISSVMKKHPDQKLIILAGHTHRQRYENISHNIELRVGAGSHKKSQVQDVIWL